MTGYKLTVEQSVVSLPLFNTQLHLIRDKSSVTNLK